MQVLTYIYIGLLYFQHSELSEIAQNSTTLLGVRQGYISTYSRPQKGEKIYTTLTNEYCQTQVLKNSVLREFRA